GREYVPPRNDVEKLLCNVFEDILGISQIGVTDNFFELGGDSLKIMSVITKIRDKGYMIHVNDIIRLKSPENIAQIINIALKDQYTITNELKNKSDEQEKLIFKSIKFRNIRRSIDGQVKKLNDLLISNEVVRRYPLSSMQNVLLNKKILTSGTVLEFNHSVDSDKLSKIMRDIINTQSLFRCALIKARGKYELEEHQKVGNINIPFIDISEYSLISKNEFDKEMLKWAYGSRKWAKIKDMLGNLLYEFVLVKYSELQWKLYIPVCHLIFDGMSRDILQSLILKAYYNDLTITSDSDNDFLSYLNNIDYGPIVAEDVIIEKFKLEKFRNLIAKEYGGDKFKFVNHIFKVKSNHSLRALQGKELWNISYKLFNQMVRKNFESNDIAFAIMFADRKYRDREMYSVIGALLDIIPVIDTGNADINYGVIEELIDEKQRLNINFANLMHEDTLKEKYAQISRVLGGLNIWSKDIPVFNFLGIYMDYEQEEKEVEGIVESEVLSMTVDITCSADTFMIYGFCKKGEENIMSKNLQDCFDSLKLS
ncbi:MAG: phosphopantetheine-binding protein, partial [Oscillospiraceae bacterium]|nr:phosphopantetheine-binding protein [Oscillospiraceae bacterium]